MDWDVRRFEELDSTNRYLLDEARAGAREGVVAVADHQTAGRGRLGRTWDTQPEAALLVSFLLRPTLPGDRLHLVTAAVAVAAAAACEDVAGVRPELKWPNDLLVGDRKLAGVLAEADLPSVVVGIGINVRSAPDGAACLGVEVSRDALLDRLLVHLGDRYGRWDDVAAEHRRRCSTIGRTVRVELADETFTGTAADVDADGRLLVDVGVCIRTVTAGDVIHLRPID
jgi:BirA family biotin operon repressor/biotin-[acetyl-CoA-carboxylase] ligase